MSCMSSSSMSVHVPFRAGSYAIWREVRTPLASSSDKGIQNTLAEVSLVRIAFDRVGISGTVRINHHNQMNALYAYTYVPPSSV